MSPLRLLVSASFFAAALSAAPASAQTSPEASQAQDLTNCAGVVAAYADVDVLAYPRGAVGEWGEFLGVLIARMNVEPGIEGMSGRYAASAARSFWSEQTRDAQAQAASQCRDRFGRA